MKRPTNSKDWLNNIELASGYTIGKYLELEDAEDRTEIANFIYLRFRERYIDSIEHKKNGFCIMANCCLMVEALESFYNGWKNTKGKIKGISRSELAFSGFFTRVDHFKDFRDQSSEFYKNVRCGILHQAETTGGWRIRRVGKLFDRENLIINADVFLGRLKNYLQEYRNELENATWDNEVWKKFREKMNFVIKNCERS